MDSGERRLLATMPLHAITAMHCEAGQRERLAIETAGFPEAGRRQITRAFDLAAGLHAADRRQREPYVNHLPRVTIRILSHYRIRDPDIAAAALLHDAVEDHAAQLAPGGSQQEALAAIGAQFGQRVADLVAAVTNPDYKPGRDTRQQYRKHVAASLETSPWARVIKISDFTANGAGLIHTTGPRPEKLAAKYAPLVPVLRKLITPDTLLPDDVKATINEQLDLAAQRFTAILGGHEISQEAT